MKRRKEKITKLIDIITMIKMKSALIMKVFFEQQKFNNLSLWHLFLNTLREKKKVGGNNGVIIYQLFYWINSSVKTKLKTGVYF